MDDAIGSVIAETGSEITFNVDAGRVPGGSLRVGSVIKAFSAETFIAAEISEVKSDGPSRAGSLFVANLLGELVSSGDDGVRFGRGVSVYPVPEDPIYAATDADLSAIYGQSSQSTLKVGTLYQDAKRPAFVMIDELLSNHFAILGTTGSGKSCALTVILYAILEKCPNAHVVLLDPHNEYSSAFRDVANVLSVDNFQLPFWMLNFEEAARVLIRSGSTEDQESQALILHDAIAWARRKYGGSDEVGKAITVDTPVPFRLHELLGYIDRQMGRVSKPDTSKPYLRLRARIESLRSDRRFDFLFSTEDDVLAKIIGRLLRIPVDGKPLTIVDLSGVPPEIADVMVSTVVRTLFDFSVWCEREKMPPLLLVCEEAHRYIPADERFGFDQTVRVVTQIAKEGRKYGISLALVTQRPSELAFPALSQCGTVFALRLGGDIDQQFIGRILPGAAREMLSVLPSLPRAQAIVTGEAVRVPTRIRFDDLPKQRRPRSESARFSETWQADASDQTFVEWGMRRWRAQVRGP